MDRLQEILRQAKYVCSDNSLSDHDKDIVLSSIMTMMEACYGIPMLRNPEWEAKHPKVIRVYKAISNIRKL